MVDSIHSSGTPVPPEARSIEQGGNQQRTDAVRATGDGNGTRAEAAREKTDRIELSDAARKLASEARDVAPEVTESGTLSPERMTTVTQRLSEGFYDNEAVHNEIALRLMPDLRTQIGE
jgi:hypothetical protein